MSHSWLLVNVPAHLLGITGGAGGIQPRTQQFNLLNFKALFSLDRIVTKIHIFMLKLSVNYLCLAHPGEKYY